jgi:hypothetical protein
MQKIIKRKYLDPKTGKITGTKSYRVNKDYTPGYKEKDEAGKELDYSVDPEGRRYVEGPGQSLAGNLGRAVLPAAVGAGLGALSQMGTGRSGIAASGLAGSGVEAVGNTLANTLNERAPTSKAAAVGAGALSGLGQGFNQANRRNAARSRSVTGGLLSGLGGGVQGAAESALGAIPGGESLSKGVEPLMGGIFNSIKSGDSSSFLRGLAGAAGSILTSPTLGNDISKLFSSSKASDYAGGKWGQSGVEDLTPQAPKAPPPPPALAPYRPAEEAVTASSQLAQTDYRGEPLSEEEAAKKAARINAARNPLQAQAARAQAAQAQAAQAAAVPSQAQAQPPQAQAQVPAVPPQPLQEEDQP